MGDFSPDAGSMLTSACDIFVWNVLTIVVDIFWQISYIIYFLIYVAVFMNYKKFCLCIVCNCANPSFHLTFCGANLFPLGCSVLRHGVVRPYLGMTGIFVPFAGADLLLTGALCFRKLACQFPEEITKLA